MIVMANKHKTTPLANIIPSNIENHNIFAS